MADKKWYDYDLISAEDLSANDRGLIFDEDEPDDLKKTKNVTLATLFMAGIRHGRTLPATGDYIGQLFILTTT